MLAERFVPVCYGSSFATTRIAITRVTRSDWGKLAQALSMNVSTSSENANSMFAERIWASLLMRPLPPDETAVMACITKSSQNIVRRYGRFRGGVLQHCDCKHVKRCQEQVEPAHAKAKDPFVSIVVLAYKRPEAVKVLLNSVARQVTNFPFEVIVADNGCVNTTVHVVSTARHEARMIPGIVRYMYIPFCENIGYARGNNKAAIESSSDRSTWLMFLNDDLELMPGFLQSMYNLAQMRHLQADVGAVGCKLVSQDGSKLLEAGSILWKDGSVKGYGRDSLSPNAPEYSYARPVDYISGACLLVKRHLFLEYVGFEEDAFKAYYEDTDLQMYLNYDAGKKVWFQPLAVARHREHGGFGLDTAAKLSIESKKTFVARWGDVLSHHLPPSTKPIEDVRARDSRRDTISVLYVHQLIPRKRLGSGFGRAHDMASALAQLGYKVTVVGVEEHLRNNVTQPPEYDSFQELQQSSVEIMTMERLMKMHGTPTPSLSPLSECQVVKMLLDSRPDLYQNIIVSRPTIWGRCFKHLAAYCNKPDKLSEKHHVTAPAGDCICPSGAVFNVGAIEGTDCRELACNGGKSIARKDKCGVQDTLRLDEKLISDKLQTGPGVDCGSPSPKRGGSSCSLILDAGALWYRRDERLLTASKAGKTSPYTKVLVEMADKTKLVTRSKEVSELYAPDAIISASAEEQKVIKGLVQVPVAFIGAAQDRARHFASTVFSLKHLRVALKKVLVV